MTSTEDRLGQVRRPGRGRAPRQRLWSGAKIGRGLLPDLFCRSGTENGSSALARFLSKLTETGDPVLIRHDATDCVDQVDACELATDNGSGMPAAGWLILEFSVGVEYNAQIVISTDPDAEHGIWGCDLQAELTLSGNDTDWPPVERIWAALAALWSTIAWDEMSGFEADNDPLGPA